jgi:hypothetical protein
VIVMATQKYGFFKKPPNINTKPVSAASRATTPGTQPVVDKPDKRPAKAIKGAALKDGYVGDRRIARAPAAKRGKEVVPRASFSGRANPKTEY